MASKKPQAQPQPYKIWMKPTVHAARRELPGHVRQQITRLIDELVEQPRPVQSKELVLPISVAVDWEVRRIRLVDWRIVYAISEQWHEIAVLTIQQRPPYDYHDLDELLAEL